MAVSLATKRALFRTLHRDGCFILPNPWDIGSAKRLEKMGFMALASTSSGAAWAHGVEDGQLSFEQVLGHLKQLCEATDLPLNADFEAGYSETLRGLADNVQLAIEAGVAGLSLEDFAHGRLFEKLQAAERIRTAHEVIAQSGQEIILVARAENFFRGRPNLEDTIQRLIAYSEAGADCLYAPGITDIEAIRQVVSAVSPKPVNVLLNRPGLRVADLAAIGVRRVSVGGALARAAWAGFDSVAHMLLENGSLPDLK